MCCTYKYLGITDTSTTDTVTSTTDSTTDYLVLQILLLTSTLIWIYQLNVNLSKILPGRLNNAIAKINRFKSLISDLFMHHM